MSASPTPSDRPNIVFITSHDLGRHLNCYGRKTVRSDNLDRFAAQGIRFENAFCTAPQCSPSRASLFSGRYPHDNGVMGLCHPPFQWDYHDDVKHLADYLKELNYQTAVIGNFHEAHESEPHGIDEHPVKGGLAHRLIEPAMEHLDRVAQSDQPFYLEMNMFEPHRARWGFGYGYDMAKGVEVPGYLQDTELAQEDFAYFQEAVRQLDINVGQVLDKLDQLGIGDDTLVLFMADHGIPFPRAKCSIYEPGLEVAFMMRWASHKQWQHQRVVPELISNVDVLPTLLDILGVDKPANLQGRSFLPLLEGGSYEPNELIFGELTYHTYCDPQRSVRNDRYKLIAHFSNSPSLMDPSQAWFRKTCTTVPLEPGRDATVPFELYDLHSDPLEQVNLVDDESHAATKQQLMQHLIKWMRDTNDPLLEGIPVPPMYHQTMDALKQA